MRNFSFFPPIEMLFSLKTSTQLIKIANSVLRGLALILLFVFMNCKSYKNITISAQLVPRVLPLINPIWHNYLTTIWPKNSALHIKCIMHIFPSYLLFLYSFCIMNLFLSRFYEWWKPVVQIYTASSMRS